MYILAFFTINNMQANEIAPLITIISLIDNIKIIDKTEMQPLSDGFYKYQFDDYNSSKDYIFICDSNTEETDSRYSVETSANIENIASTLSEYLKNNNMSLTNLSNIDLSKVLNLNEQITNLITNSRQKWYKR